MRYISRDSGPLCYARLATLWTIAADGKHRKPSETDLRDFAGGRTPYILFRSRTRRLPTSRRGFGLCGLDRIQKVPLSPTSLIIEQFEKRFRTQNRFWRKSIRKRNAYHSF